MASAQPLLQRFPCPGCGSVFEFDPKAGQLKCPYCGREESRATPDVTVDERPYEEFAGQYQTQIAALSTTAVEVECPGCRAKLTFEPTEVAGRCPFCATSIVTQGHAANPLIAPEGVLPFGVSQNQARDRIRHWLGQHWFAPNGLKKMAQQETLQGVYLPFWTFDSQTASQYSGQRGTYYYVTKTRTVTNDKGEQVTETYEERRTRWSSVSGQVSRGFDDVLVAAVRSVNVKRLEQLEPWPLEKLVAYDASFLAGFKAQRYQVPVEEGLDLAKGKMADVIRQDVERAIGGDEQRVSSVSTHYDRVTFKHILLPVWMASYRFKNRQYQVMVNAQTGEVLGDRPLSVAKIAGAVTAVVITMLSIFWFIESTKESPLPTEPIPTVPEVVSSTLSVSSTASQPQAVDPYEQALRFATRAANLTQVAQRPQDWQQVSHLWVSAIDTLKAVPADHPNRAIAQQKISEYQRNLLYAQQRAGQ